MPFKNQITKKLQTPSSQSLFHNEQSNYYANCLKMNSIKLNNGPLAEICSPSEDLNQCLSLKRMVQIVLQLMNMNKEKEQLLST